MLAFIGSASFTQAIDAFLYFFTINTSSLLFSFATSLSISGECAMSCLVAIASVAQPFRYHFIASTVFAPHVFLLAVALLHDSWYTIFVAPLFIPTCGSGSSNFPHIKRE